MAGSFAAVDITPSSNNAWEDQDLSAYIPAGATGVMLYHYNSTSSYKCCARKKGSTDGTYIVWGPGRHSYQTCGVDSNLTLQTYRGASSAKTYLLGWFTDADATFLDNRVALTFTADGAWTDIDITAQTTGSDVATGAFLNVFCTDIAMTDINCRKKGSTDSRDGWSSESASDRNFGFGVGTDANEAFQMYCNDASAITVYLQGYTIANANWLTNGIVRSEGSGWQNMDVEEYRSVAACYEINPTSEDTCGIRRDGDTTIQDQYTSDTMAGCVGLDSGRQAENHGMTGAYYLRGTFWDNNESILFQGTVV